METVGKITPQFGNGSHRCTGLHGNVHQSYLTACLGEHTVKVFLMYLCQKDLCPHFTSRSKSYFVKNYSILGIISVSYIPFELIFLTAMVSHQEHNASCLALETHCYSLLEQGRKTASVSIGI